MADGSTSNYSLILPEIDGAEGTWGTSINTNLTNLDSLLSGGTTLTAIVVDNVKIDGSNIGTVGDPDLITVGTNTVTVAGTLNATALTGPLTGDVTGNVTGNVTGTVSADALTMGDNKKITLGTGGDLEIYHDGSHSHILDKGTGSLSLDAAHFAIRSGATDDADTTPTEHIRMQVLAGSSGTTAFSAGTESSGSLSGGMTNPRLEVQPISGSNAGQVVVRGKLLIDQDPVDSTKTGSADLNVIGDITAVNLDVSGDITAVNLDVSGNITSNITVDNGASNTDATIHSSTGDARLNINTDASGGTKYASIEMGGTDGAFIDIKEPNSDDYDLRIEHGVASDDVSLVTSKYPLVLQTQASGGDVKIKREGVEKLATSATGIDVTGAVTAESATFSSGLQGNNLVVASTSDNTSAHPDIVFVKDRTTAPIATEKLGNILFQAPDGDNNATNVTYGKIMVEVEAVDASADTYSGQIDFYPQDETAQTTNGETVSMRVSETLFKVGNQVKAKIDTNGIDVTGTVTADGLSVDVTGGYASIQSNDDTSGLMLKSTHTGNDSSPDLLLRRTVMPNGITAPASYNLHAIQFEGLSQNPSDASDTTNSHYVRLLSEATNSTKGAPEGQFKVEVATGSGSADRFKVNKDGIDVTGEVSIGDATSVAGATNRLNIGANGELLIYHNGNDSYIKESDASGSLTIQGQNIFIKNTAGDKNFIHTDSNIDVRLSYDGSTKLQTTTGGVFVTGAVVASAQGATTGGQVKFREGTNNGTNTTILQAPADAGSGLTINLPSSAGTLALTSDIGFVAPTTVVGSSAINDMTSNISKKYVHTGGAVTLKFPNVTASSNLGNTWVVVNAGTDTLTFDRVTSGTSQFIKLNGSTVATAANTITLSKGGVAELTVTADNQIIIFGSGVI